MASTLENKLKNKNSSWKVNVKKRKPPLKENKHNSWVPKNRDDF